MLWRKPISAVWIVQSLSRNEVSSFDNKNVTFPLKFCYKTSIFGLYTLKDDHEKYKTK